MIYSSLFDFINVPLEAKDYIKGAWFFIVTYFIIFSFLNAFSTKFRSFTPFDKKIHIILQSVKFSNKIIINIITIGCFFLWDERLMLVENWNDYKNIFYNLSSLFAWSEVMALLINRGSMTVQCQLHHTGVVIAYIYVITSQQFGEGLFRACIMYGVFAAHACFHNMYTVIKNVVNLSQETDIWMNKVSHIGMLGSNVVNWSWQILYLMILTIKYANSGELVKYSPLLIFYVLVLVVFVKESWLMISHFGKQAGREVVNNIRRRSSIIADKFKASMINNKILEED